MNTLDDDARRMLVALLRKPGDVDHAGIEELKPFDRLFLIATCSSKMIEMSLSETAGYNAAAALQGLDALVADMREQIVERCARYVGVG